MIITSLKILPFNEMRQECLDILDSVKGPALSEPGCLCSCIYEEYGDEMNILYIEQWRSLADLERHIKSSSYTRILDVMELSFTIPEILFHSTDESWGLELVEKIRNVS